MLTQNRSFGLILMGLMSLVVLTTQAQAQDQRAARSEEVLLTELTHDASDLRLDADHREIRIPFTIAPSADPQAIELLMNAIPDSAHSDGRIEAFVNRSRAVVLQPRAEPFEARFSLYSDDLRAGDNTLILRLVDPGEDGWTISAQASRGAAMARRDPGFIRGSSCCSAWSRSRPRSSSRCFRCCSSISASRNGFPSG